MGNILRAMFLDQSDSILHLKGGTVIYELNATTTKPIINALIHYQNNVTDPKAAVNFVVQYTAGEVLLSILLCI